MNTSPPPQYPESEPFKKWIMDAVGTMYECDINGNALTESDSVKATQPTKDSNNSIIVTDDNVVDTDTDADVIVNPDEIIVDQPVISDNSVVSENMIETE